mgnify:CR=1 FL=1|jgi:hypothetical protein
MARRELNVFSLSFLDAMTCGLGAVILLFVVINASVEQRANEITADRRAEVDRLQDEVLDGFQNLVELRNSVREVVDLLAIARGLAARVIEDIEDVEEELAPYENTTIARKEHLNKLKADLKSLEEAAKRLSGGPPKEETPGDRLRSFVGDGDRQYLTGLKVGGARIFILVDASASMLGKHVVNIIRRRNLADEQKVRAGKWQQAVATVDWLTSQIPRSSRFQIYTFNTSSSPVVAGTDGQWLDGGDRELLERAMKGLRQVVPADGTSLYNGLAAVLSMQPPPDNLILLVDGLPTQGEKPPRGRTVTGEQRMKLFAQAVRKLPTRIPVNVILFPMEGDPMASSAFWKLAIGHGGAFLSPSEDWP